MADDPQIRRLPKWAPISGAIAILLLAAAVVVIFATFDRVERTIVVLQVGDLVPDLEMTTLDERRVSVSEFRGRPLVLNFWASWCSPCRREFPVLVDAKRRGSFTLLGVVYQDSFLAAQAFAAQYKATWPLIQDQDGFLAATFAVRAPPGIPQTVFIDEKGRYVFHAYGDQSADRFEINLLKAGGQLTPKRT